MEVGARAAGPAAGEAASSSLAAGAGRKKHKSGKKAKAAHPHAAEQQLDGPALGARPGLSRGEVVAAGEACAAGAGVGVACSRRVDLIEASLTHPPHCVVDQRWQSGLR